MNYKVFSDKMQNNDKSGSSSVGKYKPTPSADANDSETEAQTVADDAEEIGGREGPEPTRYGDWEKNGRCIDF